MKKLLSWFLLCLALAAGTAVYAFDETEEIVDVVTDYDYRVSIEQTCNGNPTDCVLLGDNLEVYVDVKAITHDPETGEEYEGWISTPLYYELEVYGYDENQLEVHQIDIAPDRFWIETKDLPYGEDFMNWGYKVSVYTSENMEEEACVGFAECGFDVRKEFYMFSPEPAGELIVGVPTEVDMQLRHYANRDLFPELYQDGSNVPSPDSYVLDDNIRFIFWYDVNQMQVTDPEGNAFDNITVTDDGCACVALDAQDAMLPLSLTLTDRAGGWLRVRAEEADSEFMNDAFLFDRDYSIWPAQLDCDFDRSQNVEVEKGENFDLSVMGYIPDGEVSIAYEIGYYGDDTDEYGNPLFVSLDKAGVLGYSDENPYSCTIYGDGLKDLSEMTGRNYFALKAQVSVNGYVAKDLEIEVSFCQESIEYYDSDNRTLLTGEGFNIGREVYTVIRTKDSFSEYYLPIKEIFVSNADPEDEKVYLNIVETDGDYYINSTGLTGEAIVTYRYDGYYGEEREVSFRVSVKDSIYNCGLSCTVDGINGMEILPGQTLLAIAEPNKQFINENGEYESTSDVDCEYRFEFVDEEYASQYASITQHEGEPYVAEITARDDIDEGWIRLPFKLTLSENGEEVFTREDAVYITNEYWKFADIPDSADFAEPRSFGVELRHYRSDIAGGYELIQPSVIKFNYHESQIDIDVESEDSVDSCEVFRWDGDWIGKQYGIKDGFNPSFIYTLYDDSPYLQVLFGYEDGYGGFCEQEQSVYLHTTRPAVYFEYDNNAIYQGAEPKELRLQMDGLENREDISIVYKAGNNGYNENGKYEFVENYDGLIQLTEEKNVIRLDASVLSDCFEQEESTEIIIHAEIWMGERKIAESGISLYTSVARTEINRLQDLRILIHNDRGLDDCIGGQIWNEEHPYGQWMEYPIIGYTIEQDEDPVIEIERNEWDEFIVRSLRPGTAVVRAEVEEDIPEEYRTFTVEVCEEIYHVWADTFVGELETNRMVAGQEMIIKAYSYREYVDDEGYRTEDVEGGEYRLTFDREDAGEYLAWEVDEDDPSILHVRALERPEEEYFPFYLDLIHDGETVDTYESGVDITERYYSLLPDRLETMFQGEEREYAFRLFETGEDIDGYAREMAHRFFRLEYFADQLEITLPETANIIREEDNGDTWRAIDIEYEEGADTTFFVKKLCEYGAPMCICALFEDGGRFMENNISIERPDYDFFFEREYDRLYPDTTERIVFLRDYGLEERENIELHVYAGHMEGYEDENGEWQEEAVEEDIPGFITEVEHGVYALNASVLCDPETGEAQEREICLFADAYIGEYRIASDYVGFMFGPGEVNLDELGDRNMLPGWCSYVDPYINCYVRNEAHPDGYDQEYHILELIPEDETIVEIEGDAENGFDIRALACGETTVTIVCEEELPEEVRTFTITVTEVFYDLWTDSWVGDVFTTVMVPGQEMTIKAYATKHYLDEEGSTRDEEPTEETYEWSFSEDAERYIDWEVDPEDQTIVHVYAKEVCDYDLGCSVRILSDGEEVISAFRNIGIFSRHTSMLPSRIDDMYKGETREISLAVLEADVDAEELVQVRDQRIYTIRYFTDTLQLDFPEGTEILYEEEDEESLWAWKEVEFPSAEEAKVTLTMICDWEFPFEISTSFDDEEFTNGYYIHCRRANIWFEDMGSWEIFPSTTERELCINLSELEDISDVQVTIKTGHYGEEEEQEDGNWRCPFIEEEFPGFITEKEPGVYVLNGSVLCDPETGEVQERDIVLLAEASVDGYVLAQTENNVHFAPDERSLEIIEDQRMLPGWNNHIDPWIRCFIRDEEHPYGENIDYQITELSVEDNEVIELNGDMENGWDIQALDYGEVTVSVTTEEELEEGKTFQVIVTSEFYDLWFETWVEGINTCRMLPDQEMTIQARNRHFFVNEWGDNCDEEVTDGTYNWHFSDGSEDYIDWSVDEEDSSVVHVTAKEMADVQICYGATLVVDGEEVAGNDSDIWINYDFFEIIPDRIDPMSFGETKDVRFSVVRFNNDNEERIQDMGVTRWRIEYFTDVLDMTFPEGTEICNEENDEENCWRVVEVNFPSPEETTLSMTMIATWNAPLRVCAIMDDEWIADWQYDIQYNRAEAWIEENDDRIFPSTTERTYYLNTENLSDLAEYEVSWQVGYWDENGFVPVELGDFIAVEEGQTAVTIHGAEAFENGVMDIEEELHLTVWIMSGDQCIAESDHPLRFMEDKLEPEERGDSYMLPGYAESVPNTFRVNVQNEQFRDETQLECQVVDFTVVNEDEEQPAVLVSGSQEEGWRFEAAACGHASAVMTIEVEEETIEVSFEIYVMNDFYLTYLSTENCFDRLIPGEEGLLRVNTEHHVYDEETGEHQFTDNADAAYEWTIDDPEDVFIWEFDEEDPCLVHVTAKTPDWEQYRDGEIDAYIHVKAYIEGVEEPVSEADFTYHLNRGYRVMYPARAFEDFYKLGQTEVIYPQLWDYDTEIETEDGEHRTGVTNVRYRVDFNPEQVEVRDADGVLLMNTEEGFTYTDACYCNDETPVSFEVRRIGFMDGPIRLIAEVDDGDGYHVEWNREYWIGWADVAIDFADIPEDGYAVNEGDFLTIALDREAIPSDLDGYSFRWSVGRVDLIDEEEDNFTDLYEIGESGDSITISADAVLANEMVRHLGYIQVRAAACYQDEEIYWIYQIIPTPFIPEFVMNVEEEGELLHVSTEIRDYEWLGERMEIANEGILYAAEGSDELTLDTPGRTRIAFTETEENGGVTLTVPAAIVGDTAAYLEYVDEYGTTRTIYAK